MGGLGNIIATTMPSVSYRNTVNAVAVIMQILMFYPQGCVIASPWALLCRAVGAGFQLTEASRNKQCFQFRLSLFSLFLRVLSQTVNEPVFGFPERIFNFFSIFFNFLLDFLKMYGIVSAIPSKA